MVKQAHWRMGLYGLSAEEIPKQVAKSGLPAPPSGDPTHLSVVLESEEDGFELISPKPSPPAPTLAEGQCGEGQYMSEDDTEERVKLATSAEEFTGWAEVAHRFELYKQSSDKNTIS